MRTIRFCTRYYVEWWCCDDSTIEISSNNLSVLKVPNVWRGDGIDKGGTFDENRRTLSVSSKLPLHLSNTIHVIGGNSQNNTIDFGTDDVILFDTDNTERMKVDKV